MGCTRSRQGSAALSHVRKRAAGLGVLLGALLCLSMLAAGPAMGSAVLVNGGTLRYNALQEETNNVTITQSGADSFTVADSVALTPSTTEGCTAVDANTATCTGAASVRVNAGNMDDQVTLNITAPSQIFGRAGADVLTGGAGVDRIEGDNATLDPASGDQINVRGPGPDFVPCDGEDIVWSDPGDSVTGICTNDVAPSTQIGSGPDGPTNDTTPTFSFIADEPAASYECALDGPVSHGPVPCSSPQDESGLTAGSYTLQVRAFDQVGPGPWTSRTFSVDTTAPEVIVTRLAPTDTSTAHFQLDAVDDNAVTFECWIGSGNPDPCSDIFTTSELPDGDHVLSVKGTDAAGNSTTTTVPFTINAVRNGGGTGPPTPPSVQPRRIIIESLVLISGRPVKMSKRGVVSIGLQCAGTKKCTGRMTITTAEPVNRRRKKLERLGSTRFSIAANKSRRIKVHFPKRKTKLARKLKRFKAKVVITEVDQRGNARISSRVFILRAR